MPIDIRSDTVTRPTPAMRRAIAEAEVGDDYLDGDPTTRRLEARVAELLGKERALFFPSGTMANQCAINVLSRRGTEIFADISSHIVDWEMVGAAAVSGTSRIPGTRSRSAESSTAMRRPPGTSRLDLIPGNSCAERSRPMPAHRARRSPTRVVVGSSS